MSRVCQRPVQCSSPCLFLHCRPCSVSCLNWPVLCWGRGPEAGRDAVVAAAVANCEAQMDGDRKTTALKSLQVWIRAGQGTAQSALVAAAGGGLSSLHLAVGCCCGCLLCLNCSCMLLVSNRGHLSGTDQGPLTQSYTPCNPGECRATSGRAALRAASSRASCLPTCPTRWRSGAGRASRPTSTPAAAGGRCRVAVGWHRVLQGWQQRGLSGAVWCAAVRSGVQEQHRWVPAVLRPLTCTLGCCLAPATPVQGRSEGPAGLHHGGRPAAVPAGLL